MTEKDFLGGSTEDLRVEFRERKKFLDFFRSKGYPLLDSLYEKRLYGLVNDHGEVVVPTPIPKRFGTDTGITTGINYVVDLFNKLRSTYINTPGLKFPKAVEKLQPKKSFERFEQNYNEYEILLVNKILPVLLNKITEPNPSLSRFLKALEASTFLLEMREYPITRSGYALSKQSSVYHTGLYIDVMTDQDTNLDQQKAEMLSDPNFECYVSLAHEHGFLIDANAPWRLVVDLESPVTKANIMNGRDVNEFEAFYKDVYTVRVAHDDYWSLKSFTEKLYIEFYNQNDQPLSSMKKDVNTERYLEFLLTCHFKNLGIISELEERDQVLFSRVLKKAIDTNSLYGLTSSVGALGFINFFLSQQILMKMRENENTSNTGHQQQLPGDIPLLRI